MTTAVGTKMNSRSLKKHLKYIVPEMRLALIKEPGVKPKVVMTPDDLERFVEPLKHYSDFVPQKNMFRLSPEYRWQPVEVVQQGT